MQNETASFDPDCRRCQRLSAYLDKIKQQHPDYHARPVVSFGADRPKLLIVGLAPGLHGANKTGRPFTGDHAGILLYETLYRYNFSNKPTAKHINDGLRLIDCKITNAVKCLPPGNKPVAQEINNCNPYLREELRRTDKQAVILCLGAVSHKAVIKALSLKQSDYPFKHAAVYELDDGKHLIDSYHCSRYNTQTGRLTETMFNQVFESIKKLNIRKTG